MFFIIYLKRFSQRERRMKGSNGGYELSQTTLLERRIQIAHGPAMRQFRLARIPRRRHIMLQAWIFQSPMLFNEHFKVQKSIRRRRFECIQHEGMLQHGFHPVCFSNNS
jgi:hypothetical protein